MIEAVQFNEVLEVIHEKDDHAIPAGGAMNLPESGSFRTSALATPLVISVPKQKTAGQTTDALVEFVDIYPSLSELTGLKLPAHLEGTSFVPVLENSNRPWKSAVFGQYPRSSDGQAIMGYSLRTDRYRFVGWLNRKDHSKVVALELYAHQKDPQENQNIANLPENKVLADDLLKQLRAGWQAAKPK